MKESETEQRNADTTREFLTAWHELSTAKLLPYFPMAEKLEFNTSLLTAKGNLVYTERLDHFWLKDGPKITLAILGVFEFDAAGKIKAWRDYFDLKSWLDQGGPEL